MPLNFFIEIAISLQNHQRHLQSFAHAMENNCCEGLGVTKVRKLGFHVKKLAKFYADIAKFYMRILSW